MIKFNTHIFTNRSYEPLETAGGQVPDPDYIKGIIELTIDGQEIITRAEWDLVDQLWAYIVHGGCELVRRRSFTTRFPDQPIELLFTVDVVTDSVTVELRYPGIGRPAKVNVPRCEFIEAIAGAAEPVFRRLIDVAPANRDGYDAVLRQIESLKCT